MLILVLGLCWLSERLLDAGIDPLHILIGWVVLIAAWLVAASR